MASKWVKVSDNDSRVIVDTKRKRTSQILRASNRALAARRSLVLNKTGKRKRDESCKSKCFSSTRTILLKNYSNFLKTGVPQRLLFSQDGQWLDFSQDVIDLVKQDFLAKKSSTEVKFKGRHLLIDILHMTEVDLKTGVQKPIAWIDDTGSCFFPETYSSYESHQCDKSESHNALELVELESSTTPEIKLQVEIDLNEFNNNNFEECMDESDVQESNTKRVKLDHTLNDSCKQLDAKADLFVEKIQQNGGHASPISCQTLDEETARNMFNKGINQEAVEVIGVKKCSGDIMESRLELFEKQVELTKKLRGNANVKYAWFASSMDAPSSTVLYGLGHDGPKLGRYGYGVHLTAVDSAHHSATICDVDEKGVRCMLLCRVILGNMELVFPGSKQFYPSDECFDSGVDNLDNPNHYVVWNMNMNTHIYPEYAVTFKMFQGAEGNPLTDGSRVDLSSTAPKSPWMPFSKLFEAISDKVSPDNMKLVYMYYESLKGKKTSREEFIRKLRSLVGDQILRSTISSLQTSGA